MIARWREQGLVAGPEWHWNFVERRGVTVTLDPRTAHRLHAEADRRGTTVAAVIRDLWAEQPCAIALSA